MRFSFTFSDGYGKINRMTSFRIGLSRRLSFGSSESRFFRDVYIFVEFWIESSWEKLFVISFVIVFIL